MHIRRLSDQNLVYHIKFTFSSKIQNGDACVLAESYFFDDGVKKDDGGAEGGEIEDNGP